MCGDRTFFSNKYFEEALNIEPFSDDVDKDVVSFPLALIDVGDIGSSSSGAVEFLALFDVLFESKLIVRSICERFLEE